LFSDTFHQTRGGPVWIRVGQESGRRKEEVRVVRSFPIALRRFLIYFHFFMPLQLRAFKVAANGDFILKNEG